LTRQLTNGKAFANGLQNAFCKLLIDDRWLCSEDNAICFNLFQQASCLGWWTAPKRTTTKERCA